MGQKRMIAVEMPFDRICPHAVGAFLAPGPARLRLGRIGRRGVQPRTRFGAQGPGQKCGGDLPVFFALGIALAAGVGGLDQIILDAVGVIEQARQMIQQMLGVKPGTLRHRMRKLGIPFGRMARRKKNNKWS